MLRGVTCDAPLLAPLLEPLLEVVVTPTEPLPLIKCAFAAKNSIHCGSTEAGSAMYFSYISSTNHSLAPKAPPKSAVDTDYSYRGKTRVSVYILLPDEEIESGIMRLFHLPIFNSGYL